MTNTQTGRTGERLALLFCKQKKWKLIARNWRFGRGEIDIIAQDKSQTVFIEVKFRTNNIYVAPEESITEKKQSMLRHAITGYLSQHRIRSFRVDVLAIEATTRKAHVRHLKDIELLPS